MAEKLEDLNLPYASVLRIIKESLPENTNIGKDVKEAIAKAASMFVLYITSQGLQACQGTNRKTLQPQDIFHALEEAEFGHFVEQLKENLKDSHDGKTKKGGKAKKGEVEEDEEMEDEEEEDDTEKDDA